MYRRPISHKETIHKHTWEDLSFEKSTSMLAGMSYFLPSTPLSSNPPFLCLYEDIVIKPQLCFKKKIV